MLLTIEGLGWICICRRRLPSSLFLFIAVAAGLAEFPLELWLLVFGVSEQRWREQVRVAGQ